MKSAARGIPHFEQTLKLLYKHSDLEVESEMKQNMKTLETISTWYQMQKCVEMLMPGKEKYLNIFELFKQISIANIC